MLGQVAAFNKVLQDFKINATCESFQTQGSVSSYFLNLSPGTKVKSLQKYSKEISLALKSSNELAFSCDFNTGLVRADVVDFNQQSTSLNSVLFRSSKPKDMQLPIFLGKDYLQKNIWIDLADNPHMIVAGSTGSGKTVALHNIIGNLIWRNNARIYLVDPKGFEFSSYSSVGDINVVSTYEQTVELIDNMVYYMENVFMMLKNGIDSKYVIPTVIVIDEYADLALKDEKKVLYKTLCALAQKCRAAKIHIILATQRPSSSIIDGNIKANFPARLACKVSTRVDSKIIIDDYGAEELLGKGDAIFINSSTKARLKIAYASSAENKKLNVHD